jgi:hypothetical protein
VRVAVLDEADKMLGLGFKPQIDRLKELLLPPRTASRGAAKKQRRVQVGEPAAQSRAATPPAATCAGNAQAAASPQVALFTATLPAELDGVAASWLHQPQVVRLGGAEASISRSVTQVVQVCAEHKKVRRGMGEGQCGGGRGAQQLAVCTSVVGLKAPCPRATQPAKLQKHLERVQEASKGLRNPPRILIFVNRWAGWGAPQPCPAFPS